MKASLAAKASALRGLRAGPEAPEPLEPVGGFVPLCQALCVTLLEEWVIAWCTSCGVEEPPSPRCSGSSVLPRHLARTRVGVEDQARAAVDREPSARASPGVLSSCRGRAQVFARSLGRRYVREHLMGVAPELS